MNDESHESHEVKTQDEIEHEVRDSIEDKVRDFDFDSVAKLFGIIERQSAVMPRMTAFTGIAGLALEMLHEQAKAIQLEAAELRKQKEAEAAEAERRRLDELRKEEQEAINRSSEAKAAAERDANARAKLEAEKAERAKAPITSEPHSPRAAPNPSMADNRRI